MSEIPGYRMLLREIRPVSISPFSFQNFQSLSGVAPS